MSIPNPPRNPFADLEQDLIDYFEDEDEDDEDYNEDEDYDEDDEEGDEEDFQPIT